MFGVFRWIRLIDNVSKSLTKPCYVSTPNREKTLKWITQKYKNSLKGIRQNSSHHQKIPNFPWIVLTDRFFFQKHCDRIADSHPLGKGELWSLSGSFIVFHDNSLHQSLQEPRLPRLVSITSKKNTQILNLSWKTLIENFISKKLQSPLLKMKVYLGGSVQKLLKID